MERSSNLSMKASTGSGTDEWDTSESSSAAIYRAVFPKSTHLLMLMLVSLSISDSFRICEQKPSLASYIYHQQHIYQNESISFHNQANQETTKFHQRPKTEIQKCFRRSKLENEKHVHRINQKIWTWLSNCNLLYLRILKNKCIINFFFFF